MFIRKLDVEGEPKGDWIDLSKSVGEMSFAMNEATDKITESMKLMTKAVFSTTFTLTSSSPSYLDLLHGRIDMGRYEMLWDGSIQRKTGVKPLLHKGRKNKR